MLLKQTLMISKLFAMVLITGYGVSAAYATCISSVCRAKGSLYDCHAVPETPAWICSKPKPVEASAPPVHAPVHDSRNSSTLPSMSLDLSRDPRR